MFEIVENPKLLAFYKALGKPNAVFTSVLTLVSLKGDRRENILIFLQCLIGILFSLKISQNGRLLSSCVMHMK